jgi:hypothetical protein
VNADVKEKFSSYPADIATVLHQIRDLILSVANQEGIDELEETLKWGEPSYITTMGSTIRFDYKVKNPGQVWVYFNCKTTLIETFKEVYRDTFHYSGNRAIILEIDQNLPMKELSHCLSMALRYKKIKHLDLLGA